MTRAALVTALLCLGFSTAEAQSSSTITENSVLQRRISIHLRDVALRDALDRVALIAGIRLSYSGETIPLDRRVSVSRDTSSIADVLDDLLRTYSVQPVAVADDHIVLTPREPASPDSSARGLAVLDRIVVLRRGHKVAELKREETDLEEVERYITGMELAPAEA